MTIVGFRFFTYRVVIQVDNFDLLGISISQIVFVVIVKLKDF